ncbi:MAG: hypothetical protein AVDCRST_MAG68-2083 [uncultured Gemmatimonadetes bacterium]|uniref:DNA 5'-3' helicase n=1 Tax=uncultured Gemmatimonadota bacterium TaxID=203437 RepID=A0A6J4L3G6_9BACT|nr:MAG: hypothetical protein AVDCRST_MAG68-2083 [uncultured Gemmatimonadota bacterium]
MTDPLEQSAWTDSDHERSLIASCLIVTAFHRKALDNGLGVEHFAHPAHQHMWAAMAEISDRGGHPTVHSVSEILHRDGNLEAAGGRQAIDHMTADTYGVDRPAAFNDAVSSVKRNAAWRANAVKATALLAAAQRRVPAEWRHAEERLGETVQRTQAKAVFTPDDRSTGLMEALQGGRHVERFAWPLGRLNSLSRGGARRGHLTVMAGPPSHGKSCLLDGALEGMWAEGRRVALYLNEMEPDERTLRITARLSGVSLSVLQEAEAGAHRLTERDAARVLEGMQRDHIDIVKCSGWTAARICQHARRQAYDVVGVDILQRLRSDNGKKRHEVLDDAVNEFDRLAKDGPGRHVIVCAHVNRARAVDSGRFPMPSIVDLKDTGSLGEIADNVLFVWRKQDPKTLEALDVGIVRFAKCRGGKLGGEVVVFDGEHQRFNPGTESDERELAA